MADHELTRDIVPSTVTSKAVTQASESHPNPTQEDFDAVTFTAKTEASWWGTHSGAFVQMRSSDSTCTLESRWTLIANHEESGDNVYRLLRKVPEFVDLSYKACVHGATPTEVLKGIVSINRTLKSLSPDRAKDWKLWAVPADAWPKLQTELESRSIRWNQSYSLGAAIVSEGLETRNPWADLA